MTTPVYRFAPSPNGPLHLGHAYSALLNDRLAREDGDRLLLRIEDIDTERCRPEHERAMRADLDWLGITFEQPVRRQSDHFPDYRAALDVLIDEELVYPAFLSRGQARAAIADFEAEGRAWPRDPDGAPLYPGTDRTLSAAQRRRHIDAGDAHSWRLDMEAALKRVTAPLDWHEDGNGPQGETGRIVADAAAWGDFVVARRDVPTSYQLAVVVDDAIQGVTHVVRGRDLFYATAAQRLLQELLGLPVPLYRHHRLVLDEDGRKLSKSRGDAGLSALRAAGLGRTDVEAMLDLAAD